MAALCALVKTLLFCYASICISFVYFYTVFQSEIQSEFSAHKQSHDASGRDLQNNAWILAENTDFFKIDNDTDLYSAYFDYRNPRKPYLRLLLLVKTGENSSHSQIICHFGNDLQVIAEFYELCENHNKLYRGYLVSCLVPKSVRAMGSSTAALTVPQIEVTPVPAIDVPVGNVILPEQQLNPRYNFSICIPPLFGNKYSINYLTNYFKIQRNLGVQHITVYIVDSVPWATRDWLLKLTGTGYLTVLKWNHRKPSRFIWNQGQTLAIQDCLFRSMVISRVVAFHDFDEFIIPQRDMSSMSAVATVGNLQNMLVGFFRENLKYCGYTLVSHHFPVYSNEGVNLTRDVVTSPMSSNLFGKPVVRPQLVFEVGIHHISREFDRSLCYVPEQNEGTLPNVAIHHYKTCVNSRLKRAIFCIKTNATNFSIFPYL